ncbi:hypothetical protein [Roseateles sp. L2-2]|uniref:hypothetical protein n=1 Tax=Roseateles sp. L2-2 TaxID=3422597 RepID=UPI003D35CFE1
MPLSQSLCIGARETPPLPASNVHDPARLRSCEVRFIDRLADRLADRHGCDRAAAVRASMAHCLEDFLEADWGVRLRAGESPGPGKPDPMQARALARLFTNRWETPCPGGVDATSAFPENDALQPLLLRIDDMRTPPDLFLAAARGGGGWERPLDPTLVDRILRIAPHALMASLDRALDWHRWPRAGHGDRQAGLSRGAVYRSVDTIRTFQNVLQAHPRATLRELFERFSNHVTIWLSHLRPDGLDAVQTVPRGHRQSEMRTTVLPPTSPATLACPPAVSGRSRPVAASPRQPDPPCRADPPATIADNELSAWLRHYAPFNPFKRRDRTVAPLLRDAIALRLRASGPLRRRAAEKLLRATVEAAEKISRGLERLGKDDARRVEADNGRLKTLWRLIEDTRNRYDLPLPELPPASATVTRRSWLPWRRRAQRQAQPE